MEPRKLFVGGIPKTGVTSDDLKSHFARYGDVVDAIVMTYPDTGLGRGFGFVEFADEAAVLKALDPTETEKHVFNDKKVDVKKALKRHPQTPYRRFPNSYRLSPQSVPYFPNASYIVPAVPYFYPAQGFFNYGYMMNQTYPMHMMNQTYPMHMNYGNSMYLGYPPLTGGMQGYATPASTSVHSEFGSSDLSDIVRHL